MKGMTKGIGPNRLGSAAKMMKKSPLELENNGQPTKKQVRRMDMYAGASGQDLGLAKLEQYRKDNPRAARKMSADQEDRIIDSYRGAEISRRRARMPEYYYDTSKLTDKGKKKIAKIASSTPRRLK